MATEFENVFDDLLSDAVIGKYEETISSDGDPVRGWNHSYFVQAYKELAGTGSLEISRRDKTESTYEIYCPVESSSGALIDLDRTLEVIFGSSYSSRTSRYKVEDFDKIVDDHIEIEASLISDD